MARHAALAAVAVLASCDKHDTSQAPPPPQEVGVVTLTPRKVTVTTELPGRITPFLVAEVRARVDGIILKRCFVEGSDVKAGQLLFLIDPAPYKAALDGAEAALQKARATLIPLRAQAARFKILVAANAVSKQDYANAVSAAAQADADLAANEAQVETARINLGYTQIRAPISGRIGFSDVTVGAYVQASSATLMATIQQVDPVYVDVIEPVSALLELRRDAARGQIDLARSNAVKTTLRLEDGSPYPLAGLIQFSDITVNPGTGSVTLRAIYPNPNFDLLPGMFVHADLAEGVTPNALLVPEIGVTHDPSGQPTALVVGPDNRVVLRDLVTSKTVGTNWLVEQGLVAGDRVIVDGVQFARPGAIVKPIEVTPPESPDPEEDR